MGERERVSRGNKSPNEDYNPSSGKLSVISPRYIRARSLAAAFVHNAPPVIYYAGATKYSPPTRSPLARASFLLTALLRRVYIRGTFQTRIHTYIYMYASRGDDDQTARVCIRTGRFRLIGKMQPRVNAHPYSRGLMALFIMPRVEN